MGGQGHKFDLWWFIYYCKTLLGKLVLSPWSIFWSPVKKHIRIYVLKSEYGPCMQTVRSKLVFFYFTYYTHLALLSYFQKSRTFILKLYSPARKYFSHSDWLVSYYLFLNRFDDNCALFTFQRFVLIIAYAWKRFIRSKNMLVNVVHSVLFWNS